MHLQESQLLLEFEMPLHCMQYLQPVRKGDWHMGKELKADKNHFKDDMKNLFLLLLYCFRLKKKSLLMHFHFPISFYYEEDWALQECILKKSETL